MASTLPARFGRVGRPELGAALARERQFFRTRGLQEGSSAVSLSSRRFMTALVCAKGL
jgi:hypothetical protein